MFRLLKFGTVLVASTAIAFVLGILVGWLVHDFARYDSCLDRINYDKALWHLCDRKQPSAAPS